MLFEPVSQPEGHSPTSCNFGYCYFTRAWCANNTKSGWNWCSKGYVLKAMMFGGAQGVLLKWCIQVHCISRRKYEKSFIHPLGLIIEIHWPRTGPTYYVLQCAPPMHLVKLWRKVYTFLLVRYRNTLALIFQTLNVPNMDSLLTKGNEDGIARRGCGNQVAVLAPGCHPKLNSPVYGIP